MDIRYLQMRTKRTTWKIHRLLVEVISNKVVHETKRLKMDTYARKGGSPRCMDKKLNMIEKIFSYLRCVVNGGVNMMDFSVVLEQTELVPELHSYSLDIIGSIADTSVSLCSLKKGHSIKK